MGHLPTVGQAIKETTKSILERNRAASFHNIESFPPTFKNRARSPSETNLQPIHPPEFLSLNASKTINSNEASPKSEHTFRSNHSEKSLSTLTLKKTTVGALKRARAEVKRSFLPSTPETALEVSKNYISNAKIDWVGLKCTFEYDSRFVEIFHSPTGCLDELKRKIYLKFGESAISHLVIKFKDEKADLITIVFDEDLNIALNDYNTKELFLFDDPETKLSWT